MTTDAPFAPVSTAEVNAAFTRAMASYKADAIDEAVPLFEALGRIAPLGSQRRQHYLHYMVQCLGFKRQDYAGALDFCERATREFPHIAANWFLTGRVLAQLRQPRRAFGAFKRAWKLEPEARSAYEISKILHAAGRLRLAVKMARIAGDMGLNTNHMHSMLANDLLYLGEPAAALTHMGLLEAATGPTPHLSELQQMAKEALRIGDYLRDHPGQPVVRHIAIGGTNYVGSTLLGTLLGSIDGVAFAGETQDLTHRWNPGAGASTPIDFVEDDPRAYNYCRLCGSSCEVFTRQFRQGLVDDPVDTYTKIGLQLGVETLVTADKTVTRLRLRDPQFRFWLIALYKSPRTWVRSNARQFAKEVKAGLRPADDSATPTKWLNEWARTYEELLRMPIPSPHLVAVNWDRFVEAPHAHFERLLKRLRLIGDPGVFERLTIGHFIGGNSTDNLARILNSRAVTFKSSDAPHLTDEQEAEADDHERARAVARRLDRRYLEVFG